MKIVDILTKKVNFQRRKVFKIALDKDMITMSDKPGYGFDDYEF